MKKKKEDDLFLARYCAKKIYPRGGLNDFQAEHADRMLFFINERTSVKQIQEQGINFVTP